MEFCDIERMAFTGQDMPSDANTIEHAAYLGMRYLYALYQSCNIDIKTAAKQKAKLKAAYEKDALSYRCYLTVQKRWNAVEWRLKEVETGDNENLKHIVRILDGRELI